MHSDENTTANAKLQTEQAYAKLECIVYNFITSKGLFAAFLPLDERIQWQQQTIFLGEKVV